MTDELVHRKAMKVAAEATLAALHVRGFGAMQIAENAVSAYLNEVKKAPDSYGDNLMTLEEKAMTDNLPPGPYDFQTTALPDEPTGKGHIYILDATGRKIGVCWGKPDEKLALAALIIEAEASMRQR